MTGSRERAANETTMMTSSAERWLARRLSAMILRSGVAPLSHLFFILRDRHHGVDLKMRQLQGEEPLIDVLTAIGDGFAFARAFRASIQDDEDAGSGRGASHAGGRIDIEDIGERRLDGRIGIFGLTRRLRLFCAHLAALYATGRGKAMIQLRFNPYASWPGGLRDRSLGTSRRNASGGRATASGLTGMMQ